jgi:hypothetical protein
MSQIHPKLKNLIFTKLDEDFSDKEIIPSGRTFWVIEPEKNDWLINVTCNGLMEFNTSFAKTYSNLFSLDFKVFSKLLREWIEKKMEIRINNSQRRTPNLQYLVVDAVSGKNGKWSLDERFGFSYDFIKKFVTLKKSEKRVLVQDFISLG